jgi:hypothetical protein
MALDTVGILAPIDFAGEQTQVLSAKWRQVFVNEAPLYSRLPHIQATSQAYTMIRDDVRQGTFTMGTGGVATTGAATFPIADASPFMVGDVVELVEGATTERVEVTAAPNLTVTPNTVPIRRAREGTVAATFTAAATIRLIGNSRQGTEVDQQAYRPTSTPLEQYVQTVQYPVQIGGLAEAISNVALPPGANSVLGKDRAVKLVDATRELERSMYYGLGEKPTASGDRAKMKGLRTLIASYANGANVRTAAGASYTFLTFFADTIQKIYDANGAPDTVLCSTNFLAGIFVWAPNKTAMMGDGNLGTNALGLPIKGIRLPMGAADLTFVPAPMLRAGTAIVLTSADLDVRYIREMYWNPRGNRGDAIEGEWIGDYCINLSRPQSHAWVEGITSFA